jgi:hypothetical protein
MRFDVAPVFFLSFAQSLSNLLRSPERGGHGSVACDGRRVLPGVG